MTSNFYIPQIDIDNLKNWYKNNTDLASSIVKSLPLPYTSALERIVLGDNMTIDWLGNVWTAWHGWLGYKETTPFEDYLQATFDTMLRVIGRKTDDFIGKIIKGEKLTKQEQSSYLMYVIRAANLIHSEREIQRYTSIVQNQQVPKPYSPSGTI